MSSISMLSEITMGALDPEGWQPLIDARPDWFEVIHLYGIKSGWERLKQLSLTRIPLHDTSTLLTGSPPPLATSMPTGSPAAPRRRDRDGQSNKAPAPGRNDHARADPAFKRCHGATDALH
jgi:uncharacterized protein